MNALAKWIEMRWMSKPRRWIPEIQKVDVRVSFPEGGVDDTALKWRSIAPDTLKKTTKMSWVCPSSMIGCPSYVALYLLAMLPLVLFVCLTYFGFNPPPPTIGLYYFSVTFPVDILKCSFSHWNPTSQKWSFPPKHPTTRASFFYDLSPLCLFSPSPFFKVLVCLFALIPHDLPISFFLWSSQTDFFSFPFCSWPTKLLNSPRAKNGMLTPTNEITDGKEFLLVPTTTPKERRSNRGA